MSRNSFSKLDDESDELVLTRPSTSTPPLITNDTPAVQPADVPEEKEKTPGQTPNFIFVSAFFIIVSTILGTGILGLPIKMAKTGFQPFLVSYTITCLMQTFTLIYTVEILQRAHALSKHTQSVRDSHAALPDLHSLGNLFLHNSILRSTFDLAVLIHFVSILISYTLAGSEAYAQLFWHSPDIFRWVIIPFVIILSTVMVVGYNVIHSVISFLTLGKGALLVLLVLVTGYVSWRVDLQPHSDWTYIGSPLLVGTVALGGGMNLLPFIYAKLVGFTRQDMIKVTVSSVSALVFVYLLNVLWCFYLLHIVPQTGEPISLEKSGQEGQISTIPLMDVIRADYPGLTWLATLIDIFVALSVTVSFLTVGTGLKHTLDGMAASYTTEDNQSEYRWVSLIRSFFAAQLGARFNTHSVRYALYFIFFGSVLAIAFLNPKSFLIVLERVTSLALNLESGIFVVIMLEVAKWGNLEIPWALPQPVVDFRWAVMLFFVFACVYNFVGMLLSWI